MAWGIDYKKIHKKAEVLGIDDIFYSQKQISLLKFKKEVISWSNKNGKRPSKTGDRKERVLANRIGFILKAKKSKAKSGFGIYYPEYAEIARENGYDWFDEKDTKQIALDKFQEVINWAIKNGRKPSRGSIDKEESALGSIFQSLLSAKRKSLLSISGLKVKRLWHPEYEQMAKKAGYDWFDV